MPNFVEFPKMARVSRECIITEKLYGTNAQIYIDESDGGIYAGSRTRWITEDNDNHGFARWVSENKMELSQLGPGRHFGEWWGAGIQRNYGKKEKVFSLFNVDRWTESRPSCCEVVPVLWRGQFNTDAVEDSLEQLRRNGSVAAPGCMEPEGVVIFHVGANIGFKKTLERDEMPKGAMISKVA